MLHLDGQGLLHPVSRANTLDELTHILFCLQHERVHVVENALLKLVEQVRDIGVSSMGIVALFVFLLKIRKIHIVENLPFPLIAEFLCRFLAWAILQLQLVHDSFPMDVLLLAPIPLMCQHAFDDFELKLGVPHHQPERVDKALPLHLAAAFATLELVFQVGHECAELASAVFLPSFCIIVVFSPLGCSLSLDSPLRVDHENGESESSAVDCADHARAQFVHVALSYHAEFRHDDDDSTRGESDSLEILDI
mmetsp:Transcript_19993/g.38562  ORF Transcript_19993/g.38562 Transcript_19993/m.38562 type:complete len:251 (+) Transcript_19993:932-1684(+)